MRAVLKSAVHKKAACGLQAAIVLSNAKLF